MKFKSYFLMGLSILMLLTVAGCSTNNSADNADQKSVNKTLVVKDHNFKGTHRGNNTAKDPDYKYSMYFGKDGNFVQDIISSKGFAGRFTEKGTYTIAKNGDITMNIDSVTEERFASDSALRTKQAPLSIVQRQGNSLNAAEDHAIKIENKQTYLLGTVNQVKLYSTDKQTVNYKEHYQTETKKYNDSYGKFSNHGFTSNGMDTPMNAIAFKGTEFIWKYGYQDQSKDENSAVMAVFEGNYSYNNNTKIMTLNITNQSKSYYGNLMNLSGFEYQKIGSPLVNGVLKLKYSNDTLTLIDSHLSSWKMKDNYPDDSSQSYPKYDDLSSSFGVSTVAAQMHKGTATKNDDEDDDIHVNGHTGFDTVNDFKKFCIKEGLITGHEDGLSIGKWDNGVGNKIGQIPVMSDDDTNDSEDENLRSPYYTLTYHAPGNDQIVFLGDDANIYVGVPDGAIRVDPESSAKIQQMVNEQ
jgi:hypothetical protein